MNRYLCIRRYLYAAICVYAYLKLDENCVYAMYADVLHPPASPLPSDKPAKNRASNGASNAS